jgi:hypothetical protein
VHAEKAGLQVCVQGVLRFKVSGKAGKTHYVPLNPGSHALIHEYLDAAGHGPTPFR